MSTIPEERYSLDYDPEFEEILVSLKKTPFHSSLLEDSGNRDLQSSYGAIQMCSVPQEEISIPRKEARVEPQKWSPTLQQTIKVDDNVIELYDGKSTEYDSSGDDEIIDLNSTYSAKTMGTRQLSHMLEVLKEFNSDEDSAANRMHKLEIRDSKEISEYPNNSKLPQYLSPSTPSPRTPINSIKLVPDRSYRLGNVSSYIQRPHQ